MIVPYIHIAMGGDVLFTGHLLNILSVFLYSDVSSNALNPPWWQWLSVMTAHAFIGVLLALLPKPVAVVVFLSWCIKELMADIPNSGWEMIVIADSTVDLVAALLGWHLGRLMMRKGRCNSCRRL